MSANDTLLEATLELLVPLCIADLRAAGGPTEQDYAWCRQDFQPRLSQHGESLLYRITSKRDRAQRTDTASMAADLIRAIAILSFFPGGVPFGGRRWFGTPALAADWAAAEQAAREDCVG